MLCVQNSSKDSLRGRRSKGKGKGIRALAILGDPGADKGGEGKSKRADKYIWNEEK